MLIRGHSALDSHKLHQSVIVVLMLWVILSIIEHNLISTSFNLDVFI